MNVRCFFQLILVTGKLIVEILFHDFSDYEWRICIFSKGRFNVFYVIVKRVSFVTNFKQPVYQTSN